MSRRRSVRTQFILFILFGEYLIPRQGWAWTGSLLALLNLLGVSGQAARSTLSRMHQRGWLTPERHGRRSLYVLTPKGRRLLEEGGHRIFEPRRKEWDGLWHVVVYSLPESKRDLRRALRQRLAWLGFGPLAPGTWVSPNDRRAEVEAMLADLEVQEYVQYFAGQRLGFGSDEEIVARCWDFDGLNLQYARFLGQWEPKLHRLRNGRSQNLSLTPSECFVEQFWITHDYTTFPRRDPNLPAMLVPEGAQGERAAEVFREFRRLTNGPANAFVEATLRNGREQPK